MWKGPWWVTGPGCAKTCTCCAMVWGGDCCGAAGAEGKVGFACAKVVEASRPVVQSTAIAFCTPNPAWETHFMLSPRQRSQARGWLYRALTSHPELPVCD